ncbi:MAG: cytochrome P450 [Vulcanimicrobiota bacterium]
MKQAVPPGPRSNITKKYFANRVRFFDEVRRDYGPLIYFRIGFVRVYLVTDPADVRTVMTDRGMRKSWITKLLLWPVVGNGLLLSEGELYKRQRRLIQPAFHRQRVEVYGRVAVESALEWSQAKTHGQPVEMGDEMMGLTLDIVGRSLFGSEMGEQARQVARSLDAFYGLVDRVVALGPLAFFLPTPRNFRFLWCLFRLNRFVDQMIRQREREVPRDDFLSMLVHAEEDGHKMSSSQVRSEALTLLLAGHETTAVAMTWIWYLLSQNPDCERRLHRELDEVLEGRPPTVEDMDRLDYTRRVVTESMRLYPPAYLVDRQPSQDFELHGYRIPRGSYVFVSPYLTQREAEFFPDPTRFDPDRWLPEVAAQRPQHSYFPFGVGPRACIGQSFAWMESILVLATLAQTWRAELDPDQVVDTDAKITLRPRYGMKMTLRRRQ